MEQIALGRLDVALVIAYLLGVTALGLWVSRGIKSSRDFFLGGRTLPWWAVGMSLVVSDIGAKDMVGLAADGYRYGLVMMNFDLVGCVFPVLVAAFLFMPFLWMAGVYTVPEYLGRRYNQHVRTFFAVLWTLFMVGTVGVIFVSAAVMFEVLLGWEFWFSIAVTALGVGVYTTLGGLKAVVVTDTVSCIVLIVGAFLAGVLSNLDSYINSASTLVVTDLYRPLVPEADDRHYLAVGRLLIVAFLLGGAAVAFAVRPVFGSVFEAFQTFMTFFQGPLLALLLLGMLTRRVTQWGGLAGMLVGVGTAVAMHSVRFLPKVLGGEEIAISYLWVAWWSFVAAVAGAVVVSLLTRPYDTERLRGLVCWIPAKQEMS